MAVPCLVDVRSVDKLIVFVVTEATLLDCYLVELYFADFYIF